MQYKTHFCIKEQPVLPDLNKKIAPKLPNCKFPWKNSRKFSKIAIHQWNIFMTPLYTTKMGFDNLQKRVVLNGHFRHVRL